MEIAVVTDNAALQACFPVLKELRPHLTAQAFVEQVERQQRNHGYVLVAGWVADEVVAVAGYRVAEYLAWGRTFYVDDLITQPAARQQGYAGALLDWLLARAQELGCDQFHLDSGVQRHDAHRLYLGRKLQISSHHFSRVLTAPAG